MHLFKKIVIGASVPAVGFVLLGVLAPRAENRTDTALRDLKVFSETFELVSRQYVEDVDFRQLERGAYQGLAESLDPWSSYYDPVRLKPLLERPHAADVGILLAKPAQQYVRIVAVIPGSPADIAGIERGQVIETIDGMETNYVPLYEADAMLHGAPGTTVKLGFFRESDDTEGKTYEVERKELADLRVTRTTPQPGVAVLRVTDTKAGIAPLVRAELADVTKAGIDSLVLDLRTNVGGTPEDAAALASLFAGPGPIGRRVTRTGNGTIEGAETQAWTGRLVVLTSRATIGEAELVADSLRARRGVALVGQPTIGKTKQQDLVTLPDGSGLWMSVAEYQRADGTDMPDKGVEPDEKVAAGGDEDRDTTALLERASAEEDEEPSGPTAPKPSETRPEPPPPAIPVPKPDAKATPKKDSQLERAIEILKGSPIKKAS